MSGLRPQIEHVRRIIRLEQGRMGTAPALTAE
jgi:hypothetical protein